jgi:hydrogenase nickel incorporation protein HypB
MVEEALDALRPGAPELVIIENVGNLVCPAQSDTDAFKARVRRLNPRAPVVELSCRSGDGLDGWLAWLRARLSL